jgi:hypothetical protein
MQTLCYGLHLSLQAFWFSFRPFAMAVWHELYLIVWLNLLCGKASQPSIIAFKATIKILVLFIRLLQIWFVVLVRLQRDCLHSLFALLSTFVAGFMVLSFVDTALESAKIAVL